MAISRHKVLSEMQQQLELASSKCGNLQKQLEIVKDKVRQTSTTNLVQREPPDEKENKMKNGDMLGNMGHRDTERNQEYQHVMSLSSSSTEDINEERDVNIIKVFYDRLGQMDYPAGHVELSDISSEENDLDIDQLLSSVNFSISNNEKIEKGKRKEKRSDKKAKEKTEKAQKRKNTKGRNMKTPLTSPYESHLTKTSRQSPLKIKNQRNKICGKRSVENSHSGLGSETNPLSRGQTQKAEGGKLKKKRQTSGINVSLTKNGGKQVFQEPIKRVMTLASELRKTKSSTGAGKKDIFTDTRSLTRLQSDDMEEKKLGNNDCFQDMNNRPDQTTTQQVQRVTNAIGRMKVQVTAKSKQYVAPNKVPVRIIRNNSVPKRTEEIILKKEAPSPVSNNMKDKGTSLSDLAKIAGSKSTQNSKTTIAPLDVVKNESKNKIGETVIPALKINAGKIGDKGVIPNSTGVAEKKIKPEIKLGMVKNHVNKPKQDTKRIETNNENNKTKNGLIPHLLPTSEDKFVKSEVRQKVNIFEGTTGPTEVLKKNCTNERMSKPRATASTVTRTNSKATLYDGPTKLAQDELRRIPSASNFTSVPVVQEEYRDKDNVDISPLTINQIRRMKDNLMKFNAIPFIVGQSTAKSYHIGLNIQQTYSLFKQTPSMTALKVSKFVDNDQNSIHSRGRSTKTGYTGRSLSTARGRETCPACGPAPDPSPEQLADPWAVPQDNDGMVIRVCTCLPKRIISFDQVLNQLYFTDMNLIKLHPNLLASKDGASEENEDIDGREKNAALPHRGTNTLYYTKLLRSIQNLKDNILG